MRYTLSVILLLIGLAVQAQQNLSLQDCRTKALKNSQRIQIAETQLETAKAQKNAARAMYLPSLSADVTSIYRENDFSQELYLPTYNFNPNTQALEPNLFIHPLTGQPVYDDQGNPIFNTYAYMPLDLSVKGAYMAGVTIEQPLFAGGKIYQGNQMAMLGLAMANENIELQRQKAVLDVDQAYWVYVAVSEKVKVANSAVNTLQELVRYVEDNVEAGMVHRNELLKVQVQLNQAQLDLQKAKNGLEMSRMALCRLIGEKYSTSIVAQDTAILINDSLLLSLGNESYTTRPEYHLLNQQVRLQEKQVKMTRGDFLPTAGVQLGYSRIGGLELNGQEYTNDGTQIMASVSIPIFHFGEGHYKIKAEKMALKQKELELEMNCELMQLEIEKTKRDLMDARLRIQMAEAAVKQAEENLRVSKDFFENGQGLLTDVLLAQTQVQQAKSELIDAKTDYKLKETQYLKASGKLSVTNLH